ncbi:Aldose 1-/Glucose-6-phosphate 1-epimerase [Cynara cardunculus var. scolymus]|uniref:glucose-6-phosphate 1-epimerase n=1 Tax=Cynara cardunculus var. scolymus TaxID=59895 RepID=A0A103Y5E3_CYNCS|nr:Aldose 1-/Glucose-6-phosphate 1-epimerase [Cynara cardunculus var. scolymus]
MGAISMTWSLPSLTSSKLPRVNRYPGMAFATVNKDTASLGVKVTEGLGNLPKVVLTSSHGSEAELYLYGGCVTSWKVGSKDLLFVRPDAVFNGQKPISGGIPHCFPQFGPGPMQQHGFARNSNWSIVDSENVDGSPVITLELKDSPYSRSMWDYSFQALYKITLDKKSLSTELKITNTDKTAFSFTTALHTYFSVSVAAVSGASVRGLKGCKTLNKDPDPKNPVEGKEERYLVRLYQNLLLGVVFTVFDFSSQLQFARSRDVVTYPGFVDCVYLGAANELYLDNGLGDIISIKNTNWPDAVLWNPHLTMEACYKDFVCVENAQIGNVELEPEKSWVATQQLSVG